jgi:hypothetical protein
VGINIAVQDGFKFLVLFAKETRAITWASVPSQEINSIIGMSAGGAKEKVPPESFLSS